MGGATCRSAPRCCLSWEFALIACDAACCSSSDRSCAACKCSAAPFAMPSIALPKVRSMIVPMSPPPNRPGDASKQQQLLAAYAMLHSGQCSDRTHASALSVQNPIAECLPDIGDLCLDLCCWRADSVGDHRPEVSLLAKLVKP